jgi:hypothetical protein
VLQVHAAAAAVKQQQQLELLLVGLQVLQQLVLLQRGVYLRVLMTPRSSLRADLSVATSGVLCRWASTELQACHQYAYKLLQEVQQ